MMARVRGVIAASMAPGRDVEGGGVDIHEDRRAAGVMDGARRGEEGEGGGDDLVAGLEIQGHERQQQRVGTAGAGDPVLGVGQPRDCGLELRPPRGP